MALSTVEINLDGDSKRPILTIETDTGYATCLLDTGAVIPVWCKDIEALKATFPSAKRAEGNLVALISGFGGEENDLSEIWEIPTLYFSDRGSDNNVLIFNRVFIAVLPNRSFEFSMILPATMFSKMNYEIINLGDKCLKITFENDRPYQVSPVAKVNDTFLKFGESISPRNKEIVKAFKEGRLIGSVSLFPQDGFNMPSIGF